MTRWAQWGAIILIGMIALGLRLPELSNRPFHGDEAVHAFKFRELWEHGVYRYDPNEFHGPTIYYAALGTVALRGHRVFGALDETDFRLAIALFGALMCPALVLLFRRFVGIRAAIWTALLMAVSPAFVFYSRYFIQEIFLVGFTLAFLGAAFRYIATKSVRWLVLAGVSVGLMLASKETTVLSLAAAVIASLAVWRVDSLKKAKIQRDFLIAGLVAVAVAYVVLSGFFSNPAGPLGYFQTFTPWLKRAGGTDLHRHPWHYYLLFLTWFRGQSGPVFSEALILIFAVVGMIVGFSKRSTPWLKFLAVYTLVLTAIYAVIPYKTPWCAINFLAPMILLAGVGVDTLLTQISSRFGRAAIALIILVFTAQLGFQAYQASFVLFASAKNPYLYAQPIEDGAKIKEKVEAIAAASPEKFGLTIQVVGVDEYYWPIPWYLRNFERVGYYTTIPTPLSAPIVIGASERDEALTAVLGKTHLMTGFFGLRPKVTFETFVEEKLWAAYLKQRGPLNDDDE